MLTAIILIAAALVAALVAFITSKPDTFRIERSLAIKAPPAAIFALINDFHAFNTWNPYARKDPAMKQTYSGAAEGRGAAYDWDGDKNVGRGRMEIIGSEPPHRVTIKLDFMTPFEAHNTADFTLVPRGDATLVTWAMHGPAPFMTKVMHTFFSLDRMVGRDFEAGLATLKGLAEK